MQVPLLEDEGIPFGDEDEPRTKDGTHILP